MKKNINCKNIEKVINYDKLALKEDYEKLFIRDLFYVLSEYLDCTSVPSIEVRKCGSEYLVNINTVAKGLKIFNKLPNI
ncbi:MAG: hypothetical protein SOW78_01815 [Clostridia bacterium]|nr:hypothetical protein [Clostridia bacterium]